MYQNSSLERCDGCGVSYASTADHTCEKQRWEDYQYQLAKPWDVLEEISAWLDSPAGRFAEFYAQRGSRDDVEIDFDTTEVAQDEIRVPGGGTQGQPTPRPRRSRFLRGATGRGD